MKKNPPLTERRPQDVMHRFDRLLAAMAPKAEPPPRAAAPLKRQKKKRTRKEKPSTR